MTSRVLTNIIATIFVVLMASGIWYLIKWQENQPCVATVTVTRPDGEGGWQSWNELQQVPCQGDDK